jgi:hypothetical protein
MSLLLIKMSMQCLDFSSYSPSIVTLSSIFASTAFVKHAKTLKNNHTTMFCKLVRKIIFEILSEELEEQTKAIQSYHSTNVIIDNVKENYLNQHTSKFVEQIAMDLVEFYKIFDSWHPGRNHLKKFNPAPFV